MTTQTAIPQITLVVDYGKCKFLTDKEGRTYIFWTLNEYQQEWLGKKIPWFLCWKTARLCDKDLHRPHMTCLTCKLRRVVTGALPFISQIRIHQVWQYGKGKPFFKQALSLAEMLS